MEEKKQIVPRQDKLAFVSGEAIAIAKEYAEQAGLAHVPLPSIIQAAISAKALRDQVRRELRWPKDKQKRVIGAPKNYVIGDAKLDECREFSRTNLFPMSTLYITEQGNISVRAPGWRTRVQADPRIFKGFRDVQTTEEVKDGGITIFSTSGYLIFWSGEELPATGVVSSEEPRAGRTPLSFLKMIAETRFQTRAFRLALSLPFEVAEDVIAGEEIRATVVETPSAAPRTGPMANIADFLARCQSVLGLRRAEVLRILGKGSLSEIEDLDEAFETLTKEQASRAQP